MLSPPSAASAPPASPAASAAGGGVGQPDTAHASGPDTLATPAARDTGAGIAAAAAEASPAPIAAGQPAAADAVEGSGLRVPLGGRQGAGAAATQGGVPGSPPPALLPWLAERIRVIKEAVRGCAQCRLVLLILNNASAFWQICAQQALSQAVIVCSAVAPARPIFHCIMPRVPSRTLNTIFQLVAGMEGSSSLVGVGSVCGFVDPGTVHQMNPNLKT